MKYILIIIISSHISGYSIGDIKSVSTAEFNDMKSCQKARTLVDGQDINTFCTEKGQP